MASRFFGRMLTLHVHAWQMPPLCGPACMLAGSGAAKEAEPLSPSQTLMRVMCSDDIAFVLPFLQHCPLKDNQAESIGWVDHGPAV